MSQKGRASVFAIAMWLADGSVAAGRRWREKGRGKGQTGEQFRYFRFFNFFFLVLKIFKIGCMTNFESVFNNSLKLISLVAQAFLWCQRRAVEKKIVNTVGSAQGQLLLMRSRCLIDWTMIYILIKWKSNCLIGKEICLNLCAIEKKGLAVSIYVDTQSYHELLSIDSIYIISN